MNKTKGILIIIILMFSVFTPLAYAVEGDYIGSWDISEQSPNSSGMTTDGNFIWILERIGTEVYKYSMDGTYTDEHWDVSSEATNPYGIATNGVSIWIACTDTDEVYKYSMDGIYTGEHWDTSLQADIPISLTTNGANIWLLQNVENVYKYSMDGTYTDEYWDTRGEGANTKGVTTDGNYFWTTDYANDEVYKYSMDGIYTGEHWDTSLHGDNNFGITTDGVYIWTVCYLTDEVYKYEYLPYPTPDEPTELFGAGFNSSTPYVELHWSHDLLDVDFFEVQNSTDTNIWDTLGYNATTQYTDYQVVNGTERYYRVRACKYQPDGWYNSTFLDVNFETVYFISGNGAPPIGDEANYLWLIIVLFLGMMGYVVLKVRR